MINYKNTRRKYKIANILNRKADTDTQKLIDFVDDNFVGLKRELVDCDGYYNSFGYYNTERGLIFRTFSNSINIYTDKIYNRISGFKYSYLDENFGNLIEKILKYHYDIDGIIVFVSTAKD